MMESSPFTLGIVISINGKTYVQTPAVLSIFLTNVVLKCSKWRNRSDNNSSSLRMMSLFLPSFGKKTYVTNFSKNLFLHK